MNYLHHAINIIINPSKEWSIIKYEKSNLIDLYTGYILVLAAIPAIIGFLRLSLIGVRYENTFGGPSYMIKYGFTAGMVFALLKYSLSIISVYLSALIIDSITHSFNSDIDFISSFKLVAYSNTPIWLSGIFSIYSIFSVLEVLGFFSFVLLYFGSEILMNIPRSKRVKHTLISGLVLISFFVVINFTADFITPKPSIDSILEQINTKR